jgi:hypothetical protein
MIIINGVKYQGNNVQIINNNVIIDGKSQSLPSDKEIHIKIDTINSLHVDYAASISVENAKAITSTSGDIQAGLVEGDIKTTSGDVNCKDVGGNVTTVSGDVQAQKIFGSVKTVSGDIY